MKALVQRVSSSWKVGEDTYETYRPNREATGFSRVEKMIDRGPRLFGQKNKGS